MWRRVFGGNEEPIWQAFCVLLHHGILRIADSADELMVWSKFSASPHGDEHRPLTVSRL